MYNYTVHPCGTVHITIGDGGNSEGVSFLAKDEKTHREFLDDAITLELPSSIKYSQKLHML